MRKTNELWTFKLCMRYIGTSEVPVSSCVKMAMDAMKKILLNLLTYTQVCEAQKVLLLMAKFHSFAYFTVENDMSLYLHIGKLLLKASAQRNCRALFNPCL